MANVRVYCKGAPCHPSKANGIDFVLVDEANDLWSGVGLDTKVVGMVEAWMPFYSEDEISRFAVDRGAVNAAQAALDTAKANTTAALSAVSTAHKTLVEAVLDLAAKQAEKAAALAALAADPENTDLETALTTATTAVTTAEGTLEAAQGAYNDAVATATQTGTLEVAAKDAWDAAMGMLCWRNGKANPIDVVTLGTPA